MTATATLTLTPQGEREIVLRRAFDAPRHLVFDASTKPELFERWLSGPPGWSLPVCEIDLKVGGTFRFVWRGPEGNEMGMRGVYREIVPPERLVHTELFDVDWTGGETVMTTALEEQAGRTALTATVLYSSQEARDGVLGSGMEKGLAASHDRLAELLAATTAPEVSQSGP